MSKRPYRWPLSGAGSPGIRYGGDYNPEQWPEEVWDEDVELMRRAGVNLVSVAIFAWASIEPQPGKYEFGWLDRVLDKLDSAGIRAALANTTASPPPWLSHLHPEVLPVRADGGRLWPGGRQAYCPSSPVYREHAARLTEVIAERYRGHPALALWHVDNEFGCHTARCYCDVSAEAFRGWLHDRYGGIDTLNHAWGTRFWSQAYGSFDEVYPPRVAPTYPNPTQALDFRRFSSDELLANYRMMRDILTEITPEVPATTNFMVHTAGGNCDYWTWAPEVDVVANDYYLVSAEPHAHIDLALVSDLTRGLARGRPWIQMEHSTSAVNWQPRNRAKDPGEMRRNSLAHVARGADAVMFFQWRASKAGAEKYHSAMLPHAGTDSSVWRETERLGGDLARLAEVSGSRVRADAVIVYDWQSHWACELDSHPSVDVTATDRLRAHYRALWERGVTVDFAAPEDDLSGYRLVIVPTLYLVSDAAAEALRAFVEGGGTALVTYFSGIVDENDHIRLGGYPGAYRDLLGISTEEFRPPQEGETVRLDDGSTAEVWTERTSLRGAEAVARYAEGPLTGVPALTRRRTGGGTAWYAGTRLDDQAVGRLTERLLAEADMEPTAATRPGVEAVRRHGDTANYLFVINHTDTEAHVPARGTDLLTGRKVGPQAAVPAGGVAVVREDG